LHHFFKNVFNKIPNLSEISSVGINDNKRIDFLKTYQSVKESLNQAKNCSQIVEDLKINAPEARSLLHFLLVFSGIVFKSYNDFFIDQNKIRKMPTGTCAPFSRKVFLLVNGKLLPCERIGQKLEYGKVTERKVEIDFDLIARKQNEFYNKMKSNCSKCDRSEICTKCLVQLKNIESDPSCDSFIFQKNVITEYINYHLTLLEMEPYLYKYILDNVVIE
jgi:uncharacterized protein